MTTIRGKVYLVGAGPGDPGLFTLRGAECLRRPTSCSTTIWPVRSCSLGCGQTLSSSASASTGTAGSCRRPKSTSEWSRGAAGQDCGAAQRGRSVDLRSTERGARRLAGGRCAVRNCARHHGRAGGQQPRRHSAHQSRRCFVRGLRHRPGIVQTKRPAAALDYAALAKFPGTLVFYMGVTTAPEWSRALIAHGKSPQTPVAIVRRCSMPDQQTIKTTLAEVGDHLGHGGMRPPAIVIVGDVAGASTSPKLVYFATAVRPDGAGDAARATNRADGVSAAPAGRERAFSAGDRDQRAARLGAGGYGD